MSIEVFLFTVIGIVAIVSAMMMLVSENAVHSALFLILNFACVAFLYILLDASFLAMVQIAVYAGAIMVLFLFVIMLLGAEKTGGDVRTFKWLSPVALTLAMSLLVAIALAVLTGEVDSRDVPPPSPMLRVAHAAPSFADDPVDIYLNDELAVEGLAYGEASDFADLPAGEYSVSLGVNDAVLPVGEPIVVEDGTVSTVVAHGGDALPTLSVVAEDISTVEGRDGRLLVFNAYTEPVSLVDPGPDAIIEADEAVDVIVEGLPVGAASEMLESGEGTFRRAFVPADNLDNPLVTLRELEIERGTATLLILAAEPDPVVEDTLRPAVVTLVAATLPQFGGPAAIGQSLFIEYVLPFQMVAVLLLAAMVGAIVLTQRADIRPKPGRPTRRKVSRPLTSVIASQTGHDVYDTPQQLPERTTDEEQPQPAGD